MTDAFLIGTGVGALAVPVVSAGGIAITTTIISAGFKAPKQKEMKNNGENKKPQINKMKLTEQKTEILDVAQNYATALLDADNTELLPELFEE